MNTPILDFVANYRAKNAVRLHMPGHKGKTYLGAEPLDITEITGADDLYHAEGIILESEENAASLFGAGATFYSTEGSSLAIRAMLYLVRLLAESRGETPRVLAGRNAHKNFLSAVALVDVETEWLFSKDFGLLSCDIDLETCDRMLGEKHYTALYITSPDYLGNLSDIRALSALCKKHGTLLLVDNAHGAYLKFLPTSLHPLDLGADLVCDSAHKTLPTLTGGAYLHVAKSAPRLLRDEAKAALALFASTSPSYLILQSLDYTNKLLSERLPKTIADTAARAAALKKALAEGDYTLTGDEPLKLTLLPKAYGYTGKEILEYLESQNIVCEFADPDFLVLMLSSETTEADTDTLAQALLSLPKRTPIKDEPPHVARPTACLSPRAAMMAAAETVPIERAVGRILASPTVSCPPAVPILVSGERIEEDAVRAFAYYGIDFCRTVK
ncbi:MAG: amino acid decarboxylase [Ruminococcaceae bacterium]|nr:amino acid decarboxylase [Oscillospiraceae bacterium]